MLKPGVTVAAAAADIKRVQDHFAQEYPDVYTSSFIDHVGFSMHVSSLRDAVVGPVDRTSVFGSFSAAVGVVLLITAANVANLFLVAH